MAAAAVSKSSTINFQDFNDGGSDSGGGRLRRRCRAKPAWLRQQHSRTANSTDRNTDLSIFQHPNYADYVPRNPGHDNALKILSQTSLPSLQRTNLVLYLLVKL